jgi:predicted DNA-binding transcriptional regulator AlpA
MGACACTLAIMNKPTEDGAQDGMPDPSAEWWTTKEVAAYLGVRVATVSTYRARRQMPAPDMTVGRTHVWRPTAIIAWHEARPRPGVGGRSAGR